MKSGVISRVSLFYLRCLRAKSKKIPGQDVKDAKKQGQDDNENPHL